MPRYLVEVYVPRLDAGQAAQVAQRARDAATESVGGRIRYVRSTLVPDDETCFHLYEGPSAEAVGRAICDAELDFERIVEAAWDAAPEPTTREESMSAIATNQMTVNGPVRVAPSANAGWAELPWTTKATVVFYATSAASAIGFLAAVLIA